METGSRPSRERCSRSLADRGRALAHLEGMYRACIAVVDASRARLFTYERSANVEGVQEHIIENYDLVNPARRMRDGELFSESRPSLGRTGDLQYTIDDHRNAHVDALDAEFSRAIVGELNALLRSTHAKRVIVCASPRMLGELREAGLPGDVELDEIPRNLVKLSPPQLREQLGDYGLLPTQPPRGHA
jgi:protein required for attachment to host cells